MEIHLNTILRFGIDRDQCPVAAFTLFKFEQKEIPFLIVEVSCQFLIAPESRAGFLKDDVTTKIPKGFMIHLGMITVGIARGILHTKTEGTQFNDFVLPTIDVIDNTLQRTFYTYLDESPDVKILKRERVHLRIDATYFKRFCALCYQDHEDGYTQTQLVRFSDGEHFEEIREDLTKPHQVGCTDRKYYHRWTQKHSQGHQEITPGCYSSKVLGTHPAHVFTMAYALSQTFGRDRATSQIMAIKTENDRLYWTRRFSTWHERHKVYLQEKTFNQSIGRYWYTHKQTFKALIPDGQKGIAQYVPLPNQPQNTSHNQWHRRLLQPLEESPRLYTGG